METVILVVVGGCLLAAIVSFALLFVWPWRRMRLTLDRATESLEKEFREAQQANLHVTQLERIKESLDSDEALTHLWKEFHDTLHAEHSKSLTDDSGQLEIVRYRQTVPAEFYFSTRSLIDVPLKTEFFKHLPGILTGLGIIGTFGGLITGLAQFDVVGTPDHVNASVSSLVGSVKSAFIVSALAILFSIAVTLIEKWAISDLGARVQALQRTIDQMFDAGAGEDYLSDIASQSEDTATHLAHLKDGLVNDLRHVLEEFGEKQSATTMEAGALIGQSVAETLAAPLATMTAAMERSMDDQQQVVHRLLDESLDTFATRLEEVVGQKLTGAAEHIEQAAQTMRNALIEAPAKLEATVARVQSVLEDIATSAEPIAANADRIAAAADKLAITVEQSTETLDYAIERFKRLGDQMGESLSSADQIAQSLESGVSDARDAAAALEGMSSTYGSAALQLGSVVGSLSEVVSQAERDAAAQEALAQSVEHAAEQLAAAQRDVDAFLAGVNSALKETHDTFAREINSTLDRTHESFHHSMATATETLAGTINDFSVFLENDFRDSVDGLQQEFARLSATNNGTSQG